MTQPRTPLLTTTSTTTPIRAWIVAGVCACQVFAAHAGAPDCPDEIRVAYADTELPPYILGKGTELGTPPGLFVEWTRQALTRMGCRQNLHEVRMPYNRIIASMGEGQIDVRVTAGFRADALATMRFPLRNGQPMASLAMAEADTRLYVRKGSRPLQWDGHTLRQNGTVAVVGTVRGHFSEKALQARQWEVESAPNWEANVKKLFAGRVAAIAGSDSVIDALPERAQMTTLDPPVQYDLFFAVVSHPFYAQYPAFTQRFWLEVCKESRPTFKRLPKCSVQ